MHVTKYWTKKYLSTSERESSINFIVLHFIFKKKRY